MLRRLFSGPLRHHLHLSLQTPTPSLPPPTSSPASLPTGNLHFLTLRLFSTSGRDGFDGSDGIWKTSTDADETTSSLFGDDASGSDPFGEVNRSAVSDAWGDESTEESKGDLFADTEQEGGAGIKEHVPWSFGDEAEEGGGLFESVEEGGEVGLEGFAGGLVEEMQKKEELDKAELDRKEKELREILKGPNRAFGDLIAASGITEDMIDSLILLKDVRHVPGLPPLREIEDRAIAKLNATSSRTELEKRKQEEVAKTRVKQVDEKGRAYATGRRKCSIARVWIQPGSGKFLVNDKEFDVYFPILDHRADLLQPFTVTDTLGRWDVDCTVKGGGVSGQVGAIRLGISKALQNFEPAYRPYLKAVGYLTRDSRVVERKKPGKAKARKSFQWVKR
ncbi:30S ribosomal protein S9 [Rhynchospora pubera]|uniref:30S ribosomal protein S9 n=1 Tax=Rhynchospora pubera TaxID=906938 RepID=A0AAV8HGQ9_9POAL|nr:30S ribosomal protein S9 [Rhynchospora pubera]